MPASSSTAVRRDTMAFRFESCDAPIARVTDSTVGIAMGTPPTMSTSALLSVKHLCGKLQGLLRPTNWTRSSATKKIVMKMMQKAPIARSTYAGASQ